MLDKVITCQINTIIKFKAIVILIYSSVTFKGKYKAEN